MAEDSPSQRAFDPVVVGRRESAAWAAYYRREWLRFLVAAVGMVRAGFGMRRFYLLVARHQRLGIDPAEAARREVSWWRVHREIQREPAADGPGDGELVSVLAQLYAYVYSCDPPAVRRAAEHRARAMHLSDAWVAAGCDPADPRLAQERLALVASYTALLDAVSRP